MTSTHSSKNADYAAGGSPLGNFERVADICANYNLELSDPRSILLVYAFKHIDAIAWQLSKGRKHPTHDTLAERALDVAIYFTLLACMEEDKK